MKHILKISAVYLIGNPEIPIHYTSLGQVEQALLPFRSKTITKKVADSIQICCKPAKAYRLVYFLRNIDGNKDGKIWGEFYVEFPFNMI